MNISSQIVTLIRGKGRNPPFRAGRVAGKVALVTGAGSGLGKAIAKLLAREGARVLLTDIDERSAALVASEICKEAGKGAAHSMQQDVSDEEHWARVVSKTCELFGCLNILVNNAGIAVLTDIDNFNSSDVRHTFEVNLEGTFFGMVNAIAVMKNTGGGSIINVSSVGGIIALPGMAAYGASKSAIRHLTKSVGIECAMKKYSIRVNSLHPGFVPTSGSLEGVTELTGKSNEDATSEIATTIPMGRPGTAEEIAYGALFLASDESSFMTASELVMDGGVSAA